MKHCKRHEFLKMTKKANIALFCLLKTLINHAILDQGWILICGCQPKGFSPMHWWRVRSQYLIARSFPGARKAFPWKEKLNGQKGSRKVRARCCHLVEVEGIRWQHLVESTRFSVLLLTYPHGCLGDLGASAIDSAGWKCGQRFGAISSTFEIFKIVETPV